VSEEVELERRPDGTWVWRFRNPDEGVLLEGNHAFGSLEAARISAETAYPGVPVRVGAISAQPTRHERASARKGVVGAVASVVAAGVVLMVLRRRMGRGRRGRS
jgi:hypothetical protein